MKPTAAPRMGGTTSPTLNELTHAARLILDNCGVVLSQNKITRTALRFQRRAPHATGYLFFQYLAATVKLSGDQRRHALLSPEVARFVTYADPTGEHAVNQVIRERGY